MVAAFIFFYDIVMTMVKGREKFVEEADDIDDIIEVESVNPPSRFQRASQQAINLPTIVFGALAVFSIMTFMVVAMPYMFTYQNPSWRAHELPPAEVQGAALYKNLGCFYCHNQFVRPQDWAMGFE